MSDGTVIYSAREAALTIQNDLDTISAIPGAMLLRTADGWVGLLPGGAENVLTMNPITGLPDWETPAGGGGGSLTAYGFRAPAKPDITNFAFRDGSQGSGTATADSGYGFYLTCPQGTGDHLYLFGTLLTAPPPWTVIAGCNLQSPVNRAAQIGGVYCRASTDHKLITNMLAFEHSDCLMQVAKYNSFTSFNSTYYSQTFDAQAYARLMWFLISNDGTNLTFAWSNNGKLYTITAVEPVLNFLSSAPDEVGFFCDPFNDAGQPVAYLQCYDFAIS
jgi:hypothetical protein